MKWIILAVIYVAVMKAYMRYQKDTGDHSFANFIRATLDKFMGQN